MLFHFTNIHNFLFLNVTEKRHLLQKTICSVSGKICQKRSLKLFWTVKWWHYLQKWLSVLRSLKTFPAFTRYSFKLTSIAPAICDGYYTQALFWWVSLTSSIFVLTMALAPSCCILSLSIYRDVSSYAHWDVHSNMTRKIIHWKLSDTGRKSK